ncbi:MAG: 4Fe-4S binding protein [Actinobacteria bacterium]|nr:4Fe-4S binding protein [Actinomycetota bacterium]
MGNFKLGKVSLRGLFGKPATQMYPVVKREFFPLTKGHIVNERMKDCILCGLCEKNCPTLAIKVDKAAETWTIDPFACIQCSTCVRICPKQCIDLKNTYTEPSEGKYKITEKKPELTPEEREAKAKADAEKAARIAAAREAAAAKKAEQGNA